MPGGFNRRFSSRPTNAVLTAIEGVVSIDRPAPGSIPGVGTGTMCCVGEFADMSNACTVSATGDITTKIQPTEVFGQPSLITSFGGFDETLGQFGGVLGNGFTALVNKKYQRLIIAAINLVNPPSTVNNGAQRGIRLWRELPVNKSTTDATPIVPVVVGIVLAGREFKSSSNRVRLAQQVQFGDNLAYHSGTDAVLTNAGSPAATQSVVAATGNFVTRGVKEGDAIVIGASPTPTSSLSASVSGTYRVVSVTNATTLVVERQDGQSFDWTTTAATSWRLYVSGVADTGGEHQLSEAAGFTTLARPLDASIDAATLLTPTVAPSANSTVFWESLSGLYAQTHPTAIAGGASLIFSNLVHGTSTTSGQYPDNNSELDARYAVALDALLDDADPVRVINIVCSARKSTQIRALLRAHVLTASQRGLTRRTIYSPPLTLQTVSGALSSTDPGVGAQRDERCEYAWPGMKTFVRDAVGFSIKTANASTTSDGYLDETADFTLASVESNLSPHLNPAQLQPPVPELMAHVNSFQRGSPRLSLPEYIALKAAGIVALRFDRTAGPIFQSGVTTSLTSGETTIVRRKMADFLQDSIADAIGPYAKLPSTPSLIATEASEITAFLNQLKSEDQPLNSMIKDFTLDARSGNNKDSTSVGIRTFTLTVDLLDMQDTIVLDFTVGNGVITSTLRPAV